MGFRHEGWLAERALYKLREQEEGSIRFLTNVRPTLAQQGNERSVEALLVHSEILLTRYDAWTKVAGFDVVAKRALNDATFDSTAEAQKMLAALTALRDAALALDPQRQGDRQSAPTWRTFNAEQVAPVVAALDSLIAAHRA
jgi:hypothetical protein